jgi:hypothetical protein
MINIINMETLECADCGRDIPIKRDANDEIVLEGCPFCG